jgi:hypothetical protein
MGMKLRSPRSSATPLRVAGIMSRAEGIADHSSWGPFPSAGVEVGVTIVPDSDGEPNRGRAGLRYGRSDEATEQGDEADER